MLFICKLEILNFWKQWKKQLMKSKQIALKSQTKFSSISIPWKTKSDRYSKGTGIIRSETLRIFWGCFCANSEKQSSKYPNLSCWQQHQCTNWWDRRWSKEWYVWTTMSAIQSTSISISFVWKWQLMSWKQSTRTWNHSTKLSTVRSAQTTRHQHSSKNCFCRSLISLWSRSIGLIGINKSMSRKWRCTKT